MKGQITIVRCTYCQSIISRPFGRTVCATCEDRLLNEPDDLGNPGIDDYVADERDHIAGDAPHPDDCECQDCRARFNAVMWGWCTPKHEAIAARGNRTGDLHA
jgi:hypothetical protein